MSLKALWHSLVHLMACISWSGIQVLHLVTKIPDEKAIVAAQSQDAPHIMDHLGYWPVQDPDHILWIPKDPLL